MTIAKYHIPPQYLNAEERRQRFLDFFNANPGATTSSLSEHMATKFGDTTSPDNTIIAMMDLGEIRREKGSDARKFDYYANTTKTVTAEEMYQRREYRRKKAMALRDDHEDDRQPEGPWHYIHKPGLCHGTRQEGQCSSRSKVYAGAGSEAMI